MKGFLKEFKEFALKGNVMSMAVGIIIGAAFTAIVNSLVDDILNPLLGLIVKMDFTELRAEVFGVSFNYGNFIMAAINFFLIAIVMFFVVKGMNKLLEGKKKEEEPAAPTEKECPFCKRQIPIGATKCPECTSDIS